MNRSFYPIMLMAYGFLVMGLFARAHAGEINYDRNLLRDVPRVHLSENNAERGTASTTEETKKSSVEGEKTETTEAGQTGT